MSKVKTEMTNQKNVCNLYNKQKLTIPTLSKNFKNTEVKNPITLKEKRPEIWTVQRIHTNSP